MSAPVIMGDSALIDSIRPQLHEQLQPLFEQKNPCLPALQATCRKILELMETTSSAETFAQQIRRDPGLTCKVLQISNSIAYSPQQTIESVSHAVSWLGLDTVRSLVVAAHLVDQLKHLPNSQRTLETIIARSLLAATYAGELGAALAYPSPGQLFTGALLHSIGDLAIAYQAPDLHQALRAIPLVNTSPEERATAERRVIGVPRLTLARALASLWNLPEQVVGLFSLTTHEMPRGRWLSSPQTYQGMVLGSTRLVEAMTSPGSRTAIDEAKRTLLEGSGLPPGRFAEVLTLAADRGRQLTRSMGLATGLPENSDRPANRQSIQTDPGSPDAASVSARSALPIHANPLKSLQAFQESLQEIKDLNKLLGTLSQALQRDVGFTRVGLALLNPHDSDQLVGRLALGVSPLAPYLQALSGSLSQEHAFFLSILKRFDPLLAEDMAREAGNSLAKSFLDTWAPTAAILAPLRVGTKPIGLIYCDHGAQAPPPLPQDYQAFLLYFTQTTLGINRLAGLM
ncbi:MAG: HDOD domain-containing protein [Nitrospira sp.]|nr:HDOD domain-containing protein [Nitrospira sp.]